MDSSSSLEEPLLLDANQNPETPRESGNHHTNSHNNDSEEAEIESSTHSKYTCSPQLVECLVCFLFWMGVQGLFATGNFAPHERPIPFQRLAQGEYVRNLTHDETREGDSVSASLLVTIALSIQVIMCLACARWRIFSAHDQTEWPSSSSTSHYDDLWATLCVYLVAVSMNRLATESVKNYVGYLRPVFYQECQPDDTYATCTGEDEDSLRKSFPSGHASASFCGFTLLALFIHTRLGMGYYKRTLEMERWEAYYYHSTASSGTSSNTHTATAGHNSSNSATLNGTETTRATAPPRHLRTPTTFDWPQMQARFISLVGVLLPMGMALYISAQRVVYNMHFPADVVGGAVLGGSISVFVHGMWFL